MTTPPTNQSKDLIRRLYAEVWNQGNLDLADDLLTRDFSHRGNIVPESLDGPAGYKEFLQLVLDGFPDTSVELITIMTASTPLSHDDRSNGDSRGTLTWAVSSMNLHTDGGGEG